MTIERRLSNQDEPEGQTGRSTFERMSALFDSARARNPITHGVRVATALFQAVRTIREHDRHARRYHEAESSSVGRSGEFSASPRSRRVSPAPRTGPQR